MHVTSGALLPCFFLMSKPKSNLNELPTKCLVTETRGLQHSVLGAHELLVLGKKG